MKTHWRAVVHTPGQQVVLEFTTDERQRDSGVDVLSRADRTDQSVISDEQGEGEAMAILSELPPPSRRKRGAAVHTPPPLQVVSVWTDVWCFQLYRSLTGGNGVVWVPVSSHVLVFHVPLVPTSCWRLEKRVRPKWKHHERQWRNGLRKQNVQLHFLSQMSGVCHSSVHSLTSTRSL